MVLNLMDVMNNSGFKLPFEGIVQLDEEEFCGTVFNFGKGLSVKGRIENFSGDIELFAKAEGKGKTFCARCGAPVEFDIDYSFEERISNGEDDDSVVPKGYMLDIAPVVLANFFSNAETKYLCREDCKGICLYCGADKNKTDCGCAEKAVDARLSALDYWEFD